MDDINFSGYGMDLRDVMKKDSSKEAQLSDIIDDVGMPPEQPVTANDLEKAGMSREASLTDLEWLVDGKGLKGEPNFEPLYDGKNNNSKDDLQLEWGYGAIPPDFSDPVSGRVERHIPEDYLADVSEVIVVARDMMNRGMMGKALISSIQERFSPEEINAASPELKKLLSLEGIIGCVAVDGRGYKDCGEAMKVAKNSPYKRFIKYVIGCQCGDHVMVASDKSKMTEADSSGDSLNDFFATDEAYVSEEVPHCRSTMLPLMASGGGDLDPSDMDPTMIDLMNVTQVPQDEAKKLWNKDDKSKTALRQVRDAFRAIDRMRTQQASMKYSDHVDASEWQMDAVADVELNAVSERPDVHVGFDSEISQFALENGERQSTNIDINPRGESLDFDIGTSVLGNIDIDERSTDLGVELAASFEGIDDIDMAEYQPKGFEGSDIFELDEEKNIQADMDIDMNSEIDVQF
jgi:hypothetical protein